MEYEQIIANIIDAERQAEALVAEARARQENVESDLAAEREALLQTRRQETEEKVRVLRLETQARTREAVTRIDVQRSEQEADLEAKADSHRQEWVAELFQMVTGDPLCP